MRTAFEMLDDELERVARATPDARRVAPRQRIVSTHFERGPASSRQPVISHFSGRRAPEGSVGTVSVVPKDVEIELAHHRGERERHEDLAEALVFERADEALDDGNGAMLADGAEAWPDAKSLAPGAVLGLKLHALVGDGIARSSAGAGHRVVEQGADVAGARLFAEDCRCHDGARVVVEDDGDKPADRPEREEREWPPGDPETHHRHEGQVDVPEMIRVACLDDARLLRSSRIASRSRGG